MSPVPALLVLEDGRVFRGRSFGANGETFGELVFSTGMSGYQETLTDPSYRGQVVLATAPHIGNTGWNDEDGESGRIWVAGYIVRDPAPRPSNWRSARSLDDELREQGIVGICDIDTRALTRHIRDRGAMRVGISTETDNVDELLARVLDQPMMAGQDLVGDVTTQMPYTVEAKGDRLYSIVAVDLGIKSMTPAQLAARGLDVHVVPAHATFDEVMSYAPDGVFFSNGPGDPSTAEAPTALLREVLEAKVPFFGICFGNQLFGRALGFDTYKLKFGHRGINQPVVDRTTGRIEVTSHNHGFAVDAPLEGTVDTEFGQVSVSHKCLNDDVVEGLELRRDGDLVAFSVQFHPEAAAGPHDANYLFDRFVSVISAGKDA
ncbi:glutamine-hydrolyzing carbamoyl-phosphate synthase small subunit [Tessaracoccus sp. MC1865]|uniref:glutamine-hydrolyzing carbamoyl-phosphate synthase small subunit n=1 Tax=unclassified Tessaracoccus TaxID=2635419 RepID=UPI001601B258|nr:MULTISPECIES: glutamine-hydrolyzing carbamoyl-phosphate synthase small subunit [unclassified Tessaracoccus]MBB1484704.1 glutamine-hydrolyzing carbamoyl-phosphate synthase small subunit [Tessaracoccus sp. MC1865]MBB1510026.1 glutamine-hydrolyzing carbamoyl-phosphate synthase small subunit [Tessaracoccus sp. MC1756]QTO36352.1 glutamine-hydrolyzing carbamoyl-phosphate synthase small subunit [Tessaracoccus sp. MC1865]